ncbi:hypothetical protein GOEFS_036_01160 [Gordonia effusa NBRC 100432]|uniref:Uncharacterized protein n=1 Tax=Gordonia effusa NBRC 100432 TaxID=1077974 RepID=H0QXX6_9ACTN|nr:DUF6541 family protein [Gordonia effusa]GAB17677.1 hypothetical protein GOEFS_036_01160 [Gordonia effusa NBRC 100432]
MMLTAWVALVTAVLLVAPGALVTRRLGVTWPVAVAAGPPVTFLIVSLATVFYGAVGFEWNLITAGIALIVALVLAWGYSRFLYSRRGRRLLPAPEPGDEPLSRHACYRLIAGMGVGVVVIVTTAVRPIVNTAFGGLDNISQVWDSLWHASSLRWIHETGVGSSLRMGELMNYDTHGFNFYPNTWHALGALIFPVTGANPVELYNTYSPAVLAITVPLGVATLAYWLARHRFSTSESATIAAIGAAIAGLFPSLPYVELELTAVPNAVGVSMAPIAAVLTISAVRDRRRILPAAVAIAGVTATHPSGLVVVVVIVGLWWVTQALWHPIATSGGGSAWRARVADVGTLGATGIGALVLSAPVIYGTIKIAGNNELSGFDFRDESATLVEALKQALFNYTIPLNRLGPVWILVLASMIGLLVLIWLRCWGGLAAWLVFVLVAANSVVALGPLSDPLGTLGGYFYNSGHRLTFVTAIFAAAAAAVAVGVVTNWVAKLLAARTSAQTGRKPFARVAVPAVFAIVLVLVAGGAVLRYPANAQLASKERGDKFIGPNDLAAYHWLADQPDARKSLILNNLDQGTGWIYPVTGLTPLFPFYRANDFSQRQRDLYWGVGQIGADPKIDAIVRDMKVRYVIDSPPSYWWFQNGVPDPEHGRQGDPFLSVRTKGAPGLKPVFRKGNVTVYRVSDEVLVPR